VGSLRGAGVGAGTSTSKPALHHIEISAAIIPYRCAILRMAEAILRAGERRDEKNESRIHMH
jgi:hypothetical protein